MRALVLQDYHDIRVEERPDAAPPADDEARIRLHYTGICGSDIHGYTGENGRRRPGQVMGHETVGRIESLGCIGVDLGLQVGQVVTINPLVACGRCALCQAGTDQHCPDRVVIGVQPELVSAFAELITLPLRNVVPLDGLAEERHGALVEPLAVALHAAHRAGVTEGSTVLVAGCGPIGQSTVLAALRLGAARVFATDVSPSRRELCHALGATTFDPNETPTAEQVRTALGEPVDVTIDAVGVQASLADALASTKIGGVIALVGMGAPRASLDLYSISTQERTIVGSFVYDADTFRAAAGWVADGDPVFDELITGTVPMGEAGAAFARLAAPNDVAGKLLVDLNGA